MKKYKIYILVLIMSFIICVSCKKNNEKVESPQSNDDNQTQVVNNNIETEVSPPVDNTKEDLTTSANNNSPNKNSGVSKNNNSNKTTNDSSSKNSSKSNSSGNSSNNETQNSNKNDNNSSNDNNFTNNSNNQNIDSRPKMVNPTVTYECPFGYEKRDSKCIWIESNYPAKQVDNVCEDGYIYNSNSLSCEKIVIREAEKSKYCEKGELVNNKCVWVTEDIVAYATAHEVDKCPSNQECEEIYEYKSMYSVPKITCTSDAKSNVLYSYTIWELNAGISSVPFTHCASDEYGLDAVAPVSVSCNNSWEKLYTVHGNKYDYTCYGTKATVKAYKYYTCPDGSVHKKTLCFRKAESDYTIKYSCKSNESLNNDNKCQSLIMKPKGYKYVCNDGDRFMDGNDYVCVHEVQASLQMVYSCPTGYTLTSDKKCKLN